MLLGFTFLNNLNIIIRVLEKNKSQFRRHKSELRRHKNSQQLEYFFEEVTFSLNFSFEEMGSNNRYFHNQCTKQNYNFILIL